MSRVFRILGGAVYLLLVVAVAIVLNVALVLFILRFLW